MGVFIDVWLGAELQSNYTVVRPYLERKEVGTLVTRSRPPVHPYATHRRCSLACTHRPSMAVFAQLNAVNYTLHLLMNGLFGRANTPIPSCGMICDILCAHRISRPVSAGEHVEVRQALSRCFLRRHNVHRPIRQVVGTPVQDLRYLERMGGNLMG